MKENEQLTVMLSRLCSASQHLNKAEVLSKDISGRHEVHGFTLIELLVVVLIIGILSAIALPQYKKAVVKARFAEAMTNLKTIAQADEVCRMEKGELCNINDLPIEVGTPLYDDSRETNDFIYFASQSADGWPSAQYKKEDVCVCYHPADGMVLGQNMGCVSLETTIDYAKLLGLPDASDCYSQTRECCACC